MRTYATDEFHAFNESYTKGLRLVLKIDFPTPMYLVSHDDIPNIPVGAIAHTIKNVSSSSQRLSPDTGRSTIGSIKLDVVDVGSAVSDRFNTEEVAGEGLTGRKVELYRGGAGMDWSHFRLEQTQQISQSVSYKNGGYKIQCADIQRAMRRDIFDLAVTTLRADFDAGAATIAVHNTDDFEACTHVASFGEQPTGSYFYFKIKYENGFEIVRATGKTGGATPTFTGCVRGRFGTTDVNHIFPIGEDDDSSIEIEEYVYLELPAPAMAHALLTGGLPGGGTIPARWNLGISAANFVNTDSFLNIGDDWFDSTDYTKGLIFRFQNVGKTDGKRFIEREVYLLAGAFHTIGADGKINLKRMTGVISSSDYVQELTPDNIVKHGSLKHDLARTRNTFDIEWSWVHFPSEEKPRYVRRNVLVDATSQGIHGESKTFAQRFKGLHNERHTYTTLINRFDAVRDRFAGPPLTIELELLPSENNLEVGDICRVFLPNVKDFTTGGHLDRAMEIQRITLDQSSGKLKASMFGSSAKADAIVDSGAGSASELPDGWYDDLGTDFATAGLSIDGSGILQSNGNLTGGTTTRTIFYYLGDFTIPAATTLTVTGNVELRIRGHFQINGTLNSGGGMPASTAGFIGTTYGGSVRFSGNNPPNYPDYRGAPYYVQGRYSAMPVLEIENNAGVLAGIPADMRGSGGGEGGDVLHWNSGDVTWEQQAAGGAGGGGGGSVVVVSRGAGYGVSGVTELDGSNGSLGAVSAIVPNVGVPAGSGGGGAPGTAIHLLDGSGVTFPIIAGNIDAFYGVSPLNVGDIRSQGKAYAANPVNLGIACARAQYVPKSRDPYPDYGNDDLVIEDGLSVYTGSVYRRKAGTAPITPSGGEFNFTTGILTPPSLWFTEPPAGTDLLYVSSSQFSIIGQTGIDDAPTWTSPVVVVVNGQAIRQVNIYSLNDATITDDTQGTFADPLSGIEAGWTLNVPALAADGDIVYVATRTFTDDGLAPQGASYSTPVIYSRRIDGTDGADGGVGATGQRARTVNIFRKNSVVINSADGTFANPLNNNAAWSYDVPALTTDGDVVNIAVRTFTDDALSPQDAAWSTPAVYSQRTDGTDGSAGATGQRARTVLIFRKNSATIVSGSGTFADPLSGNAAWSYDVPAITSDGDQVYVAVRTFTDNALSPEDAAWGTPTVYAQRTDGIQGVPGANAVDTRYPTLYKLNDSAMTDDTAGTFADPTSGMEAGWSYSIPALAADGDIVYASSRIFTSDGLAPQQANWSTPAIYAQRTDGTDGGTGATGDPGADGQGIRQVNLYKLNDSTLTSSTAGTFADPLAGNTDWQYAVPALVADLDEVYVATRTFTDDTLSPQDASWSTPAIYARREDGADGGTGPTGDPGADGDDGRDGVIIGGVKANFGTFAGANPGEMYIHGLNASGVPADVDGSFIYQGSRVTLSKGYVYTNQPIDNGFIVLETGAGTPFATASVSSKMAGCRLTVTDGVVLWEYDNNSVFTTFTATDTMLIIGRYTSPSADLIETAVLIAPIPIGTGIINATNITAINLRAISATLGQLETRAVGGSPTTPRLVLQDSQSPLQIYDDDDATSLLELKNTVDGFRIDILGDFIANSINSSQMFSEDGIVHLRGRLGLSDPSQGTGGSLSILGSTSAYSGTLNVDKNILIDQLPQGGGTGVIESGGNDVTLFWKLYYSSGGFTSGQPGFSAGQWTVKLQYKKNTDGWVDVPTASWTVTGNLQVWGNGSSEPYEWSYSINEERSHVWTGALALNDYAYRIAIQCDSGTTVGSITVGTANEPLSGAGVLEDHTHEADDIDFGVLADARIPSLATSKITTGTFANARISAASVTQHTASLYATTGHDHTGVYEPVSAKIFKHVSSGYNSADVTVSGSAPGSPAQGDIWFDTASALASASLNTAAGYILAEATATYGGFNVSGNQRGGYYGIQLNGELTFMHNGTTGGIYNHTGADWFLQTTESAGLRLYYAGAVKLETLTGGIQITGNLDIDGEFRIERAIPKLELYETDAALNEKMYDFRMAGGDLALRTRSDIDGAGSTVFNVVRGSGTAVTNVGFTPNVDFAAGIDVTGNITVTGTVDGVDVAASKYNTTLVKQYYGFGDTTPGIGSQYLYLYRSAASPPLYVRQASTGQLAKFFKNATSGATTPSPTTSEFTIENDGAPMKGALGIPYYVTSGYVGGKITVSSSAPGSPQQGDIWFDTT